MKKITITGNAGSGKSYLSLQLAQKFGLPVYHLDKYYWHPNWVKVDPADFKKSLIELCDKPEWIIEGAYIRYLEPRFEAADIIIFLDFPRYYCLWHVIKRALKNWGNVTETAPKECPEILRFVFLKWVWDFNKKHHATIMQLINTYSKTKKIYILRSKKEIQDFIDNTKELQE
jgi:adenylate kinase family enzyme